MYKYVKAYAIALVVSLLAYFLLNFEGGSATFLFVVMSGFIALFYGMEQMGDEYLGDETQFEFKQENLSEDVKNRVKVLFTQNKNHLLNNLVSKPTFDEFKEFCLNWLTLDIRDTKKKFVVVSLDSEISFDIYSRGAFVDQLNIIELTMVLDRFFDINSSFDNELQQDVETVGLFLEIYYNFLQRQKWNI